MPQDNLGRRNAVLLIEIVMVVHPRGGVDLVDGSTGIRERKYRIGGDDINSGKPGIDSICSLYGDVFISSEIRAVTSSL